MRDQFRAVSIKFARCFFITDKIFNTIAVNYCHLLVALSESFIICFGTESSKNCFDFGVNLARTSGVKEETLGLDPFGGDSVVLFGPDERRIGVARTLEN